MSVYSLEHVGSFGAVLEEVLSVLHNEGVVVLPFDTCYGFCCDPNSKKAVALLNDLKGGREDKFFSVFVSDVSQIPNLLVVDDVMKDMILRTMPGKVTVVGEVSEEAGGIDALDYKELGVRMVGSEFLIRLGEAFGRPLITTSANKGGEATCYSLAAFYEQFGFDVDLLCVDGGVLEEGSISTVVRVVDGEVDVLRQGDVTV